MKIANVAFYKLTDLSDLNALQGLRDKLKSLCSGLKLKGTILLAPEGINVMLAGSRESAEQVLEFFHKDSQFNDIKVKWSFSNKIPFKRLYIKIKKEVITLRQEQPGKNHRKNHRAPYIQPEELKRLLDQGADILLMDIRNDFEYQYGSFKGAINPKTKSFSEFPNFIKDQFRAPKDKMIVTYCTGGIRCEKGATALMDAGFTRVYQLDGGILEYFAKAGGDHFEGTCFVFDEREAVDRNLRPLRD